MVYQGNGLVDFSLSVSQIEMALNDYATSPQLGLDRLHQSLVSFQTIINSASLLDDVFYQRLSSVLSSVDYLLDSGSPYFYRYHVALMSACDALFQIAIAGQFGEDHVQQFYSLLSIDRSCWVTLISTESEMKHTPEFLNYEAQLAFGYFDKEQTVDTYLKKLSTVGRVSFYLDSVEGGAVSGRFKLFSVQSIQWLQSRFPSFKWRIVSTSEDRSLRDLCALSFLPLFQNNTMMRSSRYDLLNLFEHQFKSSFYQPFGALFTSDYSIVNEIHRLVPFDGNMGLLECDKSLTCFPVRHSGFLYAASRRVDTELSSFSYLGCLGKDFLPYFLYEISTCSGRFVFDKQECIGSYLISEKDIYSIDGALWFELEGIEVEIVLDLPFSILSENAFCLLPRQISNVLVINQAGRYFAVPFLTLREIEGVSAQIMSPSSFIKNIWLTKANESIAEPWLLGMDSIPLTDFPIEKNVSESSSRSGYYQGVVGGRSIWIEAQLVSSVVPYGNLYSFECFDSSLQVQSLFIHDGRCVDHVALAAVDFERLEVEKRDCAFSAILDWMGESMALSFESCDWLDSLPSGCDVQEADYVTRESVIKVGYRDKRNCFASLPDNFVLNKKNYVSFVTGVKTSSSLA